VAARQTAQEKKSEKGVEDRFRQDDVQQQRPLPSGIGEEQQQDAEQYPFYHRREKGEQQQQ
jgi:hypothetical protein